MINEGRGISDNIKKDVDAIYQLFIENSFSANSYKFGNNKVGYQEIFIKFNHINNYSSDIRISKNSLITVNIGIPTNGKEKRIKENIAHELTHVMEILGLNNKEYPKYNKIKLSLREFKNSPKSKAMEFITDVFYKTLDNEINANVAQTYIYIYSDGRCSETQAMERLKEWDNYKFYDSIKKIDLKLLEQKISIDEVRIFNDLLIKNKVRTKITDDISLWLNYWFKIFKRKADVFLNNSAYILKEVEEDWRKFESYYISYNPSYTGNYMEFIREIYK